MIVNPATVYLNTTSSRAISFYQIWIMLYLHLNKSSAHFLTSVTATTLFFAFFLLSFMYFATWLQKGNHLSDALEQPTPKPQNYFPLFFFKQLERWEIIPMPCEAGTNWDLPYGAVSVIGGCQLQLTLWTQWIREVRESMEGGGGGGELLEVRDERLISRVEEGKMIRSQWGTDVFKASRGSKWQRANVLVLGYDVNQL